MRALVLSLPFELLEFFSLSFEFGLLGLDLALLILFLLLPRLKLISKKGTAQKPESGTDACAGAGVSRSATDDRTHACAANGSDCSALFSGCQRLGAPEEQTC
jgi:hypothetical protein